MKECEDMVSVVVPVYNVDKYLGRCVTSLIRQTYTNLEIVLVDDKSSDASSALCDELASEETRIHVIHRNENGGLSAARNTGLDWVMTQGKSKWVTFVDSDDWIVSNMIEALVSGAKECKSKISVCGYERVNEVEMSSNGAIKFEALSPEAFWEECSRIEGEGVFLQNIACAKLFARECFAAMRFPEEIRAHEDVYTIYRAIFAQSSVAFTRAKLYCYYVNPKSITGRCWSRDRLNTVWGHQEQIFFFDKRGFVRALCIAVKQQMLRIPWAIDNCKGMEDLIPDVDRMKRLLAENYYKYKTVVKLPLSDFHAAWKILHPVASKFYVISLLFNKGPNVLLRKLAVRFQRTVKGELR